jgi:hypothetical protein
MTIRTGLIVIPTAAVAGLVLLLNGLDANAGIAAAALGVVAVVSGAALGYFSDRLPEPPRARRSHPLIPHHVDR